MRPGAQLSTKEHLSTDLVGVKNELVHVLVVLNLVIFHVDRVRDLDVCAVRVGRHSLVTELIAASAKIQKKLIRE